jgi:O-methyltransferase involved in polyketide biosynthesis
MFGSIESRRTIAEPVDFEAGEAWWERLAASGFDARRPAMVASTGVSMYLTKTRTWPRCAERYFAGRTDGLRPPNNSEELLVATT